MSLAVVAKVFTAVAISCRESCHPWAGGFIFDTIYEVVTFSTQPRAILTCNAVRLKRLLQAARPSVFRAHTTANARFACST